MMKQGIARKCVECGLPFGDAAFACQSNQVAKGPAYWSDQGLICSYICSAAHFVRRVKEGTAMAAPAPNPFGRNGR
jgi:hypothetical protein